MKVDRRSFIQQGAAIAVLAAASPLGTFAGQHSTRLQAGAASAAMNDTLSQHSLRSFMPWIGSAFKAYTDPENAMWMTLVDAADSSLTEQKVQPQGAVAGHAQHSIAPPRPNTHIKTESFTLRFQGLPERIFEQSTLTFEHHILGTFEMLIVPSGNGQPFYTAVINRLPAALHAQRLL